MRLINSYFLLISLKSFLLILAIIYSLFLFRQLYALTPLIEATDLSLLDVISFIVYLIPFNLVILSPVAFCIAIYTTFYNASMHSEIVAMQSNGLSLQTSFSYIFICSNLLGLLLLLISLFIAPNLLYQSLLLQEKKLTENFKININPGSINEVNQQMIYYNSGSVDEMQDFLMLIEDEKSDIIVIAKIGRLIFAEDQQFSLVSLENGRVINLSKDKAIDQIHEFNRLEIPLKLESEASELIELIEDDHLWNDKNYLNLKHYSLLDFNDIISLISSFEGDSANYAALELNYRISNWLSMVAFALFAFSLGINNPRFPVRGNILILVAGVIGYYQFSAIARKYVDNQAGNPLIMLIPALVMIALSYFIFQRAMKNNPFVFINISFLFSSKKEAKT